MRALWSCWLLAFALAATTSRATSQPIAWAGVPADTKIVTVGGAPFELETAGKAWSFAQAKIGDATAFRFEVRPGDQWDEDASSGENKERSELDGYKTRWSGKAPVWGAYAFLIEPGAPYKSDWTAISQMHGSKLRPFHLHFNNETFTVIAESLAGGGASEKPLYSGKLSRNAWHQLVFRLVQSGGAEGALDLWLDGAEVVAFRGPIGSDQNQTYWKFGIYRGYGPIATPLAIEFANVEVGNKDLSPRIANPLPVP